MIVLRAEPMAERINVDQNALHGLARQLGAQLAEDVVCRAMEDLSIRLGMIDELLRAEAWQELRKSAHGAAAVARQIGLDDLARVADDVVACIDLADCAALAATSQRLVRLGDVSFNALIDHVDGIA